MDDEFDGGLDHDDDLIGEPTGPDAGKPPEEPIEPAPPGQAAAPRSRSRAGGKKKAAPAKKAVAKKAAKKVAHKTAGARKAGKKKAAKASKKTAGKKSAGKKKKKGGRR